MKKVSLSSTLVLALCLSAPLAAHAQAIATVNGKEVPKSRAEDLIRQLKLQGQPVTPEVEKQVNDEVVLREIYLQEADKRGLNNSPDLKTQFELARQSLMINALFNDQKKAKPITDADIQASYDSFKTQAQASGTEYRARHILVDKEDRAKALTAQLKKGAKFEDLAKKNSKDPGSKDKGGDLDYADPKSYVPEFAEALLKLKKGEVTPTPVKSEFGYHIIKLEDTRETPFPSLDDVKPQIVKNLEQQRLMEFREQLRANAKTDYAFSK
ncbi:MAG: peptidylprolyl isomerase [Pseudomonadota bacterium]